MLKGISQENGSLRILGRKSRGRGFAGEACLTGRRTTRNRGRRRKCSYSEALATSEGPSLDRNDDGRL